MATDTALPARLLSGVMIGSEILTDESAGSIVRGVLTAFCANADRVKLHVLCVTHDGYGTRYDVGVELDVAPTVIIAILGAPEQPAEHVYRPADARHLVDGEWHGDEPPLPDPDDDDAYFGPHPSGPPDDGRG